MSDELSRLQDALSDRYDVEREIGRGGMATVYLAHDRKHDRKVAVKTLDRILATAIGAERFHREIRIAAGMHHPHVLQIYDSGGSEDLLYYVMPFIGDPTLEDRIREERQLPIEDVVSITREVASALDFAHESGVIHRDVKPANILVTAGRAILADFGIARMSEPLEAGTGTAKGVVMGTPKYMSPEQAIGDEAVDGRSDVYSLACVVYEMLSGEPPFDGPTPSSILSRSLTEEVRPLDEIRQSVGPEVTAVVRKGLARLPGDRFRTAGEFATALAVSASPPISGAFRGARLAPEATGRRRAVLIIGVVAIVAAAAWLARGTLPSRTGGIPAVEVNRIAVFPFTYRGNEERGYVAAGIANLLSTVLDGVGTIRTADPAAVNGLVASLDHASLDPEQAGRIARAVGAGRWIVGSVDEFGDRSTIVARAYSAGSPPTELLRGTVEGAAEQDLIRLVNDLALQLLVGLDVEESPRRLEAVSSGSVVALNDYLKGEDALQAGDPELAVEQFARAVEADSTFALAWFRLAYAMIWTTELGAAIVPVNRALAMSDRLTERDAALARGLKATVMTDGSRARSEYERVLSRDPDNVAALFGRADARIHFGPLLGWPSDSLSAEFERVLALDSRHFEAKVHAPWAMTLDGSPPEAVRSAAARLAEADGSGFYEPIYLGVVALVSGDSTDFAAAKAALAEADDLSRFFSINLGAASGNFEGVIDLASSLLAQPDRVPQVRALGHIVAAHALAGLGRWDEAWERLDQASLQDPAAALEARAMLAVHPLLATAADELRDLRTQLTAWNPDTSSVDSLGNPWLVPHDGWHSYLRRYLIGTLDVRLGDIEAAQRNVEALRSMDDGTTGSSVGNALASRLSAQVLFAEGRNAEGLLALAAGYIEGPEAFPLYFSSGIFSEVYERYQRGEALARLGRNDEAADVFRTLAQLNCLDLAYLPAAELALANL